MGQIKGRGELANAQASQDFLLGTWGVMAHRLSAPHHARHGDRVPKAPALFFIPLLGQF